MLGGLEKAYNFAKEIKADPFAIKRQLGDTPEVMTPLFKENTIPREVLTAKSTIGQGQVFAWRRESEGERVREGEREIEIERETERQRQREKERERFVLSRWSFALLLKSLFKRIEYSASPYYA